MRRVITAIALALLCALSTDSRADTHAAASASYADVSTAVTAATYGDTVTIPAGTATWDTMLTLTKGITLQGAGIGVTVINFNTTADAVILYDPDATSEDTNVPVRITGMTIDANWTANCIWLKGDLNGPLITDNRVDHCKLIDGTTAGVRFGWEGRFWGLIDNNQFEDCYTPVRVYDDYWYAVDRNAAVLGSDDGVVIETNTMTWTGARGWGNILSSGHGMRYTFRFNTLTNMRDLSAALEPETFIEGLDHHGNIDDAVDYEACASCATETNVCCNGNRATVYSEVYGNTFAIDADATGQFRLFGMHGTRTRVFNNDTTPENVTTIIQFGNSAAAGDEVNDAYFWTNTNNSSTEIVPSSTGENDPVVTENTHYWTTDATFDGTTGVGVGTLASRPATCTAGVAYWATDQGVWNQTGTDGVLYKCTSTDTWAAYYTPATYPDPRATTASATGSATLGTGGAWTLGTGGSVTLQ